MAYLALIFEADELGAESWSDALMEAGALAVDIADAVAGTAAESPLYGEPGAAGDHGLAWPSNRVMALFPEGAPGGRILAELAARLDLPEIGAVQERKIDEQDWVRLTQAQFGPIEISSRLWVVPSWSEPVNPAAINIKLDPGLAFGTGSHATTRLCLRWLDAHLQPDDSVLDYGCGSGLLAIAAARLGATRVIGVDIDPQAVSAAESNAQRNGVAARFYLPGQEPEAPCRIVLANILTNPLCVLAPVLAGKLAPGGALVLSGILTSQASKVIEAYASWLALEVWAEEDGWVALTGSKN